MKLEYIYLDNAATTIPLEHRLAKRTFIANPSSSHLLGRQARKFLDDTKMLLCDKFGGKPYNYIFNSGATESANFIIQGICKHIMNRGLERNEIIISAIEHPAIFNTAKKMESLGFKVRVIPVDSNGVIKIEDALAFLNQRTAMVCVMSVNNETGVIQPLNSLFSRIKDFSKNIITVCDAVQAVFKGVTLPLLTHTDCFFASGHKIGANKGIGFLYMNAGVFVEPLMYGGGQEEGLRSGTENMDGIDSLHDSIMYHTQNEENIRIHLKDLSGKLYSCLNELGIVFSVNTSDAEKSDYIHSVSFDNLPSAQLAEFLSINGIFVSRGSACSSTSTQTSRVLSAMGLNMQCISSTIRISFSPLNHVHEVELLCNKISEFKNSRL
ncbi:cysteine desulfurase family protein [Xenorhabdus bovienii]|uniref:cysteine desulfurase family protein n=1 Tax=Xenorhabdus bovienii TaxID=40576 RepID=UPI0023B2AE17|nr:cysteine desulfurase family protein [Xenorhabdus bovienii]MDE9486001.1 cysteine desulfurase [Xenorhabdus bovienii]